MQRNVGIGYGFEVVGHLLWAYAVMIVVWSVLSGLFFLVISGGKIDIVRDTLIAFAAPSFFFATVHVFIFAAFRYYFLPRFPNAPLSYTFVIATVAGSILLTLVWTLDAFRTSAPSNSFGIFPAWVGDHLPGLLMLSGMAAGLTLAAGAFGWLLEQLGGQQRLMWGAGRWLGWLITGREAYEAFLAKEAARLHQAYEDYVAEIRGKK